ncbi:unnamed protein product [Linum tenue]|uniref:Uncharacterized protein n=1 Tax=Linum tenue TaxID=586396 RepID=A0AAV0IJU0_9ROSI|nr:unnamed protein product [Linum tenue]
MSQQLDELLGNITGDELLEAQARAWNYSFNYIVSMALKCAVELGVPDAVSKSPEQPISLTNLATALPLHPSKNDALRRLMRPLVHAGFFTLQSEGEGEGEGEEEDHYSLTTAGKLYLRGGFGPSYLDLHLDPTTMTSWGMLSAWFLYSADAVPFEAGHDGASFWECLEKDPVQKKSFHDSMAADSVLVAGVLVAECREVFDGVESLVDVGGGTETMAVAIAKSFPKMECTVFDLPHVVANVKEEEESGVENFRVVGGNMFDGIPPADAVLLKTILHDWDDEKCLEILKSCREAVSGRDEKKKKGKVIIIDMVVGNGDVVGNREMYQAQFSFDLLMFATFNGKERDEEEWRSLFLAAGFSGGYKIIRSLGPRSLIEAYP